MSKTLKITAVAVVAIVAIMSVATLVIPPIVKNYVENNGEEIVGRKVSIDKVKFNIFNGKASIFGLNVKEVDGESDFLSFDSLNVQIKPLKLLQKKVIIKHIHLTAANLKVTQNGDSFNFDDIIGKFADTTAVVDSLNSLIVSDSLATDSICIPAPDVVDNNSSSSSNWDIGIYDIRLRNCNIVYFDLGINSNWDLNNINLNIPGIYFSGKATNVGLNLGFANGGNLNSEIKYEMDRSRYDIHLSLEKFSLNGILPYLQQSFHAEELGGLLNADINIVGDLEHVMDFNISGYMETDSLLLKDNVGATIFDAEHIALDINRLSISPQVICLLNKVEASNISSSFIMNADSSTNFSNFMIEMPDSTIDQQESDSLVDMAFKIDTLDISKIGISFVDKTLAKPFTYSLSNIRIVANNVDYEKPSEIKLKGNLGTTGSLIASWKGVPSNISNQNILLIINDLNLCDFTPYSADYFGYGITGGNLSFRSQNTVKNNYLDGTNVVDIYKLNMSKDDSVNSRYKLPIRAALYIMKDKNDKINISLPVSGDVTSPEFSYRKIIFKTFTNLLVKIATIPLSFIKNDSYDILADIELKSGQIGLTSEMYNRLELIADMLKEQTDLMISITQDINYTDAAKYQAMFNLKKDYYLSLHPEKTDTTLELIDFDKITGIMDQNIKLVQFADSKIDSKMNGSSISAKAKALYGDEIDEQISRMAEMRCLAMKEYLIKDKQIEEERVLVTTLPFDDTKVYKGKSIISFNVKLVE